MKKQNELNNEKKQEIPNIENYYALIAVIFNEDLSIDDAIRDFNL